MLTALHKNKDYHCSVVLLFIKKSFIDESKLKLEESVYCSEDLLFTYQLYCNARKAAQCKNTLYHRRYRSNSIVTEKKSANHFRSCRDVYSIVLSFSETIGKSDNYMATEYTVRCAYNALNTYTKLSRQDKKLCKKEFRELKKDILSHNAFGNTALKMRCHGTVFWFVYKIFEKSAGKLLKGKK